MQITVRPAITDDTASITEVLVESRRTYLSYAPMAHPEKDVRAWIEEVLMPGGGVYIAEAEGQVVGMLALSAGQDGSWIDQLYVRPGSTGLGIGTRLLQLAHARLTPPIRLFTFQANAGARRFYEQHGYAAVQFTDGAGNEERCPDVLYEWRRAAAEMTDNGVRACGRR